MNIWMNVMNVYWCYSNLILSGTARYKVKIPSLSLKAYLIVGFYNSDFKPLVTGTYPSLACQYNNLHSLSPLVSMCQFCSEDKLFLSVIVSVGQDMSVWTSAEMATYCSTEYVSFFPKGENQLQSKGNRLKEASKNVHT